MKLRKNIIKSIIVLFILLLLSVFYTTLLYFKILKPNNFSFKIITYMLSVITFFTFSFLFTANATKKGWLKGLTTGLILLMFPIVYNIKNQNIVNTGIILKYTSLLFLSMFAGVINVNKNKEK